MKLIPRLFYFCHGVTWLTREASGIVRRQRRLAGSHYKRISGTEPLFGAVLPGKRRISRAGRW